MLLILLCSVAPQLSAMQPQTQMWNTDTLGHACALVTYQGEWDRMGKTVCAAANCSGLSAARVLIEWLQLLDKTNCKLPWNVFKQPWNSAFFSLISFHEMRQPEPKPPLILCCVKGNFLFFGTVRLSGLASLIKREETGRKGWLQNGAGQTAEWWHRPLCLPLAWDS